MKVLFWVPYPTEGASNRYRVEQYLPYLKPSGIKYALRPFWSSPAFRVLYNNGNYVKKSFFLIKGIFSRLRDLLRIHTYDIVFIHREAFPLGPSFFEAFLSMIKKPFIFDFDDAVFLPASSRPNSFVERFRSPPKITNIIRMSSFVIAGNKYLADFSLRYNPNVIVIPTCVDTDRYFPQEVTSHNKELVIGWIGSITTIDFLSILKNVIIRLEREFDNLIFKIVGGNFCIEGVTSIVSKDWSLKKEREELATFDIGIMPMPDNEWTRGKCGFKAILYMSMGIPCVCSAVGVNEEIIKDGQNGYLAKTEEEWIEKLSSLIKSPQLRKMIGSEGRKTVEAKYSLKANAPKFLEVLQKASHQVQKYQL